MDSRGQRAIIIAMRSSEDRKKAAVVLEEVPDHQIATAESLDSAAEGVNEFVGGCVILGDKLGEVHDWVAFLEKMARLFSNWAVVMIIDQDDVNHAVEAVRRGVQAVIERPYTDSALLGAVMQSINRAPIDHDDASFRRDLISRGQRLSAREREVLKLLLTGLSNREMAAELNLSVRTIEERRRRVTEKLGARSMAEVVRMAVELSRLDPSSM